MTSVRRELPILTPANEDDDEYGAERFVVSKDELAPLLLYHLHEKR